MESEKTKVELLVKVKREGATSFSAECADVWGHGKTPAAALSDCVKRLCRVDALQGLHWRDAETGVSGVIRRPKNKATAARNRDKGAVFDLLGGKMNGLQRMKEA